MVHIENIFNQQKDSRHSTSCSWKQIYHRFQTKTEIFNSHFLKECTILNKNSKIPPEFPRNSSESLSSITFEINKIEGIIKNLDPKNSHAHDNLSIHILKLCGESIYYLLSKSCLETGQFPSE